MSISKSFGHPLSDRTKNGAGNSVKSSGGAVNTADFAPGSKGTGYLAINESAGGGPFHVVVKQGDKVISDKPRFVGGNFLTYSIGEDVGANTNVSKGDITFTITPAASIFNNYDGK